MLRNILLMTGCILLLFACFTTVQLTPPPCKQTIAKTNKQATKTSNQPTESVSFVSDLQWTHYVRNFRAHNPLHQEWCVRVLNDENSGSNVGSQFGQDLFVLRNVFAPSILANKTGFYVDSGANDPMHLSNTLFFDVCLGWKGLCIEPNPQYHADISKHRSCTLIVECIANTKGVRFFNMNGATGGVAETGTTVMCSPLQDMLKEHANGISHVDFWSLDVEGFEMSVLSTIPWEHLSFEAIMIEDFWLSNRVLDHFMTVNKYVKVAQLPIDSLWLPITSHALGRPSRWVTSPHLEAHWLSQMQFRDTMRLHLAKDL